MGTIEEERVDLSQKLDYDPSLFGTFDKEDGTPSQLQNFEPSKTKPVVKLFKKSAIKFKKHS